MCKLMEVIVNDHVMKYLLSKGLVNKKQHANHETFNGYQPVRMYAWLGCFINTIRFLLMQSILIFHVHLTVWYILSFWLSYKLLVVVICYRGFVHFYPIVARVLSSKTVLLVGWVSEAESLKAPFSAPSFSFCLLMILLKYAVVSKACIVCGWSEAV